MIELSAIQCKGRHGVADTLVIGCGYLGRRVAVLWRAAGRRSATTPLAAPKSSSLGLEPVALRRKRSRQSAVAAGCAGSGLRRRLRPGGRADMRTVFVDGLANVPGRRRTRTGAVRPRLQHRRLRPARRRGGGRDGGDGTGVGIRPRGAGGGAAAPRTPAGRRGPPLRGHLRSGKADSGEGRGSRARGKPCPATRNSG